MIDIEQASATLKKRYPDLERISEFVFRGTDRYEGQPYAIRYFDLQDDVRAAAEQLQDYQDALLGTTYYEAKSRPDLRWNYYLYFVAAQRQFSDSIFLSAKAVVESNGEYARKIVLPDTDLESFIRSSSFGADPTASLPPDALSIWTNVLEEHSLGFIVDESLQVPTVVRHIADGTPQGLRRVPGPAELEVSERAASKEFLARLTIKGFRKYPLCRTFDLGIVNLVSGVNGVGKTSLLEAIEYLFCRKTRRTDKAVLPRTVVTGTWADSGATLETSESTSPSKLRARHLVWYGKAELRTLTLDDSFSKFNFLDTDAAVRLTVETSQKRISDDLFQLLLGSESAKALDRLERVAKQLEDNNRVIEKDIGSRDLRRMDAAARAEELRRMPHESDHLFSELTLALTNIGWMRLPPNKAETSGLGESLQGALTNVRLLRTASDSMPRAPKEIDDEVARLSRLAKALDEIFNRESQLRRDEAAARAQLQTLGKRIEALDSLVPLVRSGVLALSRRRDSLQQELAERSAGFAEAEATIAELPEELSHSQASLEAAIERWADDVRDAATRAKQGQQALAALERLQSIVTNAQQRLRAVARELIQHTGDATHCPLCRTEFSEEQLRIFLQESAKGVAGADSDRVRSDLQATEANLHQQTSELATLRALQSLVPDPGKTSVEAAIAQVARDRDRAAELKTELDGAELALQTQEEMGWSIPRFTELSVAAGVTDAHLSPEALEEIRVQVTSEQNALLVSLPGIEAQRQSLESQTAEIANSIGLSMAMSLSELRKEISQRIRNGEGVLKAVRALETQLRRNTSVAYAELEAQLGHAHDLVVRLRTALGREQEGDQALAREIKLAEDAAAEIAGLRVKLKRVDSARVVIGDLFAKQSDRVLADQVLHENAGTIASTFAKIHAPNEFDVVAGDGLRILRRSTGSSVELEEMSSGQRAAYALSLFFAMNERLRTGPKVLIFDDPVSHVDDINTLSFLDHLRDIALTGKRQIFFATADAKLAGLVVRKFQFLGEQKFKQLELTREE